MEVIILESKAYKALVSEIREAIRSEFINLREDLILHGTRKSDWISPAEAREMLGVGKTKYCQMKSEGAFVFAQHGRKVKISRKSLEQFLRQHSITSGR